MGKDGWVSEQSLWIRARSIVDGVITEMNFRTECRGAKRRGIASGGIGFGHAIVAKLARFGYRSESS